MPRILSEAKSGVRDWVLKSNQIEYFITDAGFNTDSYGRNNESNFSEE